MDPSLVLSMRVMEKPASSAAGAAVRETSGAIGEECGDGLGGDRGCGCICEIEIFKEIVPWLSDRVERCQLCDCAGDLNGVIEDRSIIGAVDGDFDVCEEVPPLLSSI